MMCNNHSSPISYVLRFFTQYMKKMGRAHYWVRPCPRRGPSEHRHLPRRHTKLRSMNSSSAQTQPSTHARPPLFPSFLYRRPRPGPPSTPSFLAPPSFQLCHVPLLLYHRSTHKQPQQPRAPTAFSALLASRRSFFLLDYRYSCHSFILDVSSVLYISN